MTIELMPGSNELNVSLTPMPIGGLVISKLFIGTNSWTWSDTTEDRVYIEVQNVGPSTLNGQLNIYHWQESWGDPPGQDSEVTNYAFTLDPGQLQGMYANMDHRKFDNSYIRLELFAEHVLVQETPYIYYIPGKQNIGGSEEAVGECVYTAPGLAVLWYGQNKSSCRSWHGYYRTPPLSQDVYNHRGNFDVDTFDSDLWNAVFLIMLDPDFISGDEYACEISGGPHWTKARFNFIAG